MSSGLPDTEADTLESTETDLSPPYKVILHNDDVNDMVRVVVVICDLTPLTREEAIERMWEAHHTGSAVLLITHRERAELYVEEFASCGLIVTAEPDV
jgi:ATP-dependent Clp protease adaptor protein ClpS